MAENVTAEEIAELIEFVQDGRGERAYALAIAERLPALVAEANRISAECAMRGKEVMRVYAERDRFSYKLHASMDGVSKHGYVEEFRRLSAERDRLAAEVERLKRLCSGGAYDTLQSEQAWKRRAESAERESTAANAALQKIGMSLGSSDEWTDQATMIADVDGRVAAARETIANLREAVANISCGCGTMCMFMKPREACERHAATKALAQLDAPPSPTRRDAAVSRALFRDAEAGACGEKVEDGAQQWMPKTDDPIDGATETIALTRLAQAERALVEAVEIMRPFAISVSEDGWLLRLPKDAAAYRAARAFVEQHGGAK
jgi:hypothetical protein